ncbi:MULTISPECIES: hypothetical protein [Ralstonia solanacearum species complex]|uniref:Uncharacterized protein n=2 Tax=Ralstonia solanacearum species complex TaxID=3116862 RepID=A0A0S4UAH6_RALSL|nr:MULTISPECIES: hypothetical protein [Ralstonia]ARS55387.1 hypothetical protein BC427_04195 [Ralstonia solanacearum FJAT-91]AXV68850.1 hypothetical protein CJO74_05850 [Ralstonia solanacearum]ARS55432.1 hypothetical protein BC427_04485 [Ralstonia solanacearum FJAT-91]ARS55496.1 hypothetical protein BC427_04850 [Ralstonia solanacearum FJAT-91]ASL72657.1 hypothetical protein BC350_02545 [Ralstonia pseudosolanacearum]
MKIPTPAYRSALARTQPEVTDLEAFKRQGWRDQRILVVNETDERLDFIEREFIRRIGERLYGGGQRHDR